MANLLRRRLLKRHLRALRRDKKLSADRKKLIDRALADVDIVDSVVETIDEERRGGPLTDFLDYLLANQDRIFQLIERFLALVQKIENNDENATIGFN